MQVGFQSQLRLFFALILANTVAGLSSHWIHFEFLVTFQTMTLNFFTLHFLSQTSFFKFNLLLPLRQMKTMTKPSPRAHAPWLQKEWVMLQTRSLASWVCSRECGCSGSVLRYWPAGLCCSPGGREWELSSREGREIIANNKETKN